MDTEKITDTDYKTIWEADWGVCAKWWDELNSWRWPEELYPEEAPQIQPKSRRTSLMSIIEEKVGIKFLLMKANTTREENPMTFWQFEDFWRGTHMGDEVAYQRYQEYIRSY